MDSSDLLIHYQNDNSVVLLAKLKTPPQVTTNTMLPNSTIADTLISQYTFQAEFIPDTTYYPWIEHLYLDSTNFSDLIKNSNLVLVQVVYGYGGSRNFDDLKEKYGVYYNAGGCVYDPSDWDRGQARLTSNLLKIRNGSNWEQAYAKDHKEKLRKQR